jgi:hypothetical protein
MYLSQDSQISFLDTQYAVILYYNFYALAFGLKRIFSQKGHRLVDYKMKEKIHVTVILIICPLQITLF